MRTLRNYLFGPVIIAILSITVMSSHRAVAQGQGQGSASVTIVGPLPVPVTGTVNVSGNSATTPLFVRDVDNPDKSPFQGSDRLFFQGTDDNVATSGVDVPDGKLAVINHVSVSAFVPQGQALWGFVICRGEGLSDVQQFLVFQFQGNFVLSTGEAGKALFVASQPLHCSTSGKRADAEGLSITVRRNSFTGESGEITTSFSGHLTDLP